MKERRSNILVEWMLFFCILSNSTKIHTVIISKPCIIRNNNAKRVDWEYYAKIFCRKHVARQMLEWILLIKVSWLTFLSDAS